MQSLDGIVQRDDKGLEKRYPVILTAEEKLIARKVSLAFKVRHSYVQLVDTTTYNLYTYALYIHAVYMYMFCACKWPLLVGLFIHCTCTLYVHIEV